MKRIFRTVLLLCFGLGGGNPCHGNEAEKREETVYLHCFRQTSGQQVVYDDEAPRDTTAERPPQALVTLKVGLGEDFEVKIGQHEGVSGRIETKEGKLIATLKSQFGSTSHRFSGEVELERPFDPDIVAFFSLEMSCRCVFSRDKEIEPFLKAQAVLDAKRLEDATASSKRNLELYRAAREKAGKEEEEGE